LLTSRCIVWKVIFPKLEALLEEQKVMVMAVARQDRKIQRKIEFSLIWDELVDAMPDAKERCLMPNINDAWVLSTVANMLAEDDAQIPVTKERFLGRLDSVLSDVAGFQSKVKLDLVKLLPTVDALKTANPIPGGPNLTILSDVTSLFCCPWGCRALIGFPAILAHEHIKDITAEWPSVRNRLKPPTEMGPTVLQALEVFGISKDIPVTALQDLDGRCVCLCGHPKFRAPMDFGFLVRLNCNLLLYWVSLTQWPKIRHIIDENRWYQDQTANLRCAMCILGSKLYSHSSFVYRTSTGTIDILLHNDHDLGSSIPYIALLSARQPVNHSPDDDDDTPLFQSPTYCKSCIILTRHKAPLWSADEVTYHMKAK